MSGPREHIRRRLAVLDSPIDAISWEALFGRIAKWASLRESRYICLCNIQTLVAGRRDPNFQRVLESADTAAPESMAVAWWMRRRGVVLQQPITARSFLWRYAERAAIDGTPVFLCGDDVDTLSKLRRHLRYHFPGLRVVGLGLPQPSDSTTDGKDDIVARIVRSGAQVVLVGLSCPHQERWLAEVTARIPAVLIGVGTAFQYHARHYQPISRLNPSRRMGHGVALKFSPSWIWNRYIVTPILFLYYALRETMRVTANAALRLR
jgi:N-acetylglucosaminyldiphosphoundecaprenol N-acetyl-beta-D-mannosaminyltransferase